MTTLAGPSALRAAVRVAASCLLLWDCRGQPAPAEPRPSARYVGRQSCTRCHAEAAAAWRGSHHDLAMQEARADTVLGDFDDATFTHGGVTSIFFRREGGFWVRTDGPDGGLQEHVVAYTFGVEPLQQYLIEFPDGRLQALGLAWDTRPAEQGGQRWFHLYPDEPVDHRHPLHWTAPSQNWNFMCAECHSTRVRKGYDPESKRFSTTWFEIDVSCEACHGPGSNHVAWAEAGASVDDPARGLVVTLAADDGGRWVFGEDGIARRSVPRSSRTQLETCARCHSRRALLSEDYVHGRPLADTHRPALLSDGLYHADGQILDEVFVYGSFLQSKMFAAGVTCTDCHDAHSLRLNGSGNEPCAGCHLPRVYDTTDHHLHRPGRPGARCVACHMPRRKYMVVDPRADHSFRVPRPDLTVELGVPNACNGCHDEQTAEWAAAVIAERYGEARSRAPHHAVAIDAARRGLPGSDPRLLEVVNDGANPAIVRATALSLLRDLDAPGAAQALRRAAVDPDPLLRLALLTVLTAAGPAARAELGAPLLDDPLRAVRLAAATVVAPLAGSLTAGRRDALESAVEEYRQTQRLHADRAESWVNLGLLDVQLGRLERAERHYRTALQLQDDFMPALVNLADLYRLDGRDTEAERILRRAVEVAPEDGDARHALGLTLVRLSRTEQALREFEAAARLAPDNARYAYVYGVALNSTGRPDRAVQTLLEAHRRHPADRALLLALATIHRDRGRLGPAVDYARQLVELSPTDPEPRRLLRQLEQAAAETGDPG